MYDRYIRPTRIGEGLMSAVRMERSQTWDHWCICNDRSDPPPGPRESLLVRLIHKPVARMRGHELTTWREHSMEGLSRRCRDVLRLLLEGLSEKEIASALDRSEATIHENVEHIYRHFEVNSRAQLAAYFLRRRVVADPSQQPPLASPQSWLSRKVHSPAPSVTPSHRSAVLVERSQRVCV
jgi:DNA-binding CsgD family transcriptional regulator